MRGLIVALVAAVVAQFGGTFGGAGGAGGGTPASSAFTKIACVGDSLTEGVGSVLTPYPTGIGQRLSPALYSVANLGVTGDNIAGMDARWAVVSMQYNTLTLLGGINDIASGATAASVYSTMTTLLARTGPTKKVVLTLTPFGTASSWTSGKQTQLDALNTSIRGTAGVTVVDAYNLLKDPANPNNLLPAYSADGLHWNQAGTDVIAAAVAVVIP
jgi:lysophospholipase L1-like esterase